MTLKKLLFIILLFFSQFLIAQEKQTPAYQYDLDKADMAFLSKKYNTAAGLYQKVYGKIKNADEKQKVLFKVAESYRKSNNFKQAIKWYEEVLNSKYPDPKVLYSFGQLLKNYERYDEASRTFYDYLFEMPDDLNAKEAMSSCNIAAEWKSKPEKFNINNLKDINTEFSDYNPFLVGKKLYFTSSRKDATGSGTFEWTGQKYSDIFESNVNGNSYSKPSPIKGINTNFNEGAAWFDADGSSVYFTQCNGTDGKGINCKIYVSYFQNNTWTAPTPLPFNSDSFSCGHPGFSADGKTLFFSSDMPGGFGEKDIWKINYDPVKNNWGEAQNMGNQINSFEDELFPFVDENGDLYFSSKGHTGMGGLDIFKSSLVNGNYSKAENLKYPINSGGDDFGLNYISQKNREKDGMIAYFASNRDGGVGDDDLYGISIKPFVFLVKGKVLEREGLSPISVASVKLKNQTGPTIFEIKTNDKGEFTGEVPLKLLLELSASKDKYLSSSSLLIDSREIEKDSILEVTILLDQIPAEDVEITMKGIYYDIDKFDIRADARPILDSLTNVLKSNPGLIIELASHTDSRAPAEYNMDLSKKRAQSCVNYLIQKGINKDRMVAVGYGETKLVNDCSDDVDCSEEEHQMNRRTTVRILKNDFKNRGR
jgi:peptidoglycan-associated lipoprotein